MPKRRSRKVVIVGGSSGIGLGAAAAALEGGATLQALKPARARH